MTLRIEAVEFHVEDNVLRGDLYQPEGETRPPVVMECDARKMRGERPFVFTNLKTRQGLESVIAFLIERGML